MSQAFSLEPQSEAWFLLILELNQFKNCLFHLASNIDYHWNIHLSNTSLGIFRRIAGGVFPCPHLPGASLDWMSRSNYIKTPLAGLRCLCCWCGSFGRFTEMLLLSLWPPLGLVQISANLLRLRGLHLPWALGLILDVSSDFSFLLVTWLLGAPASFPTVWPGSVCATWGHLVYLSVTEPQRKEMGLWS